MKKYYIPRHISTKKEENYKNNLNIYGGESKFQGKAMNQLISMSLKPQEKNLNQKRITIDSRNSMKKRYIICPQCGEHSLISIKNYKISLYDCKNRHKNDNILLNEFAQTQKRDFSNIKCDYCSKLRKIDKEQNMFYRCNDCQKNSCINCKYLHKKHYLIDYDIKNFICDNHNLDYKFYCKYCKKNICDNCQVQEHKGHEIISYKSYQFDKDYMNIQIKNMKIRIDNFKNEIISKIKNVLDNVANNLDLYYKINNDIFNNFPKKYLNFEILSNINGINDNYELNDIDEIMKEKNIKNQFSLIYDIYQKMNYKEYLMDSNPFDTQKKIKESNKNGTSYNFKNKTSTNYNNEEKTSLQDKQSNTNYENINQINSFNKASYDKNKINNDQINNSQNGRKYYLYKRNQEKETRVYFKRKIEDQVNNTLGKESQNSTIKNSSKTNNEKNIKDNNKNNLNDYNISNNQNLMNNKKIKNNENKRNITCDNYKQNKKEYNNIGIYQNNEEKTPEDNIKNLKSYKDETEAQIKSNKKGNFVYTDKYGKKENIFKNKLAQKIPIEVKEKEIEYKKSTKPKGLYNLGLSCYMNSLLQCLYFVPELREYFIENKDKFNNNTVCKAFAFVMYGLKNEKKDYFETTEFKKIMGSKNSLFSGFKAGDAKDLYFNLIDAFITELTKESEDLPEEEDIDSTKKLDAFKITKEEIENNNHIINQLFVGYYETVYKCKNSTERNEINTYYFSSETSISFNLEKISKFYNNKDLSINDCFDYNYLRTSKNSFFCAKCNKEEENVSFDIIYYPPKILVLILDRGKGKKYRGKIKFESDLDLDHLIDQKENYNTFTTKYKLIGVSTQSENSCSGGHYTACCLADDGYYYYFNDTFVEKVTIENIYENEPYLLFYKRLDLVTPK